MPNFLQRRWNFVGGGAAGGGGGGGSGGPGGPGGPGGGRGRPGGRGRGRGGNGPPGQITFNVFETVSITGDTNICTIDGTPIDQFKRVRLEGSQSAGGASTSRIIFQINDTTFKTGTSDYFLYNTSGGSINSNHIGYNESANTSEDFVFDIWGLNLAVPTVVFGYAGDSASATDLEIGAGYSAFTDVVTCIGLRFDPVAATSGSVRVLGYLDDQ